MARATQHENQPMTPPLTRKERLRAYFDGTGFERWRAIYGDAELSGVRRSIREGHAIVLDHVETWLLRHHLPPNARILDAGCGTGLCARALAKYGYHIIGVDISPQMVREAARQARARGIANRTFFFASDLETVRGSYDAVICLDVLIHYPQPDFGHLCRHLASLSRGPLIFTYAPHNYLLALMHHIGGYFPRSERRTDIQMIRHRSVRTVLESVDMHITRHVAVSRGFYHVVLVEAQRSHA